MSYVDVKKDKCSGFSPHMQKAIFVDIQLSIKGGSSSIQLVSSGYYQIKLTLMRECFLGLQLAFQNLLHSPPLQLFSCVPLPPLLSLMLQMMTILMLCIERCISRWEFQWGLLIHLLVNQKNPPAPPAPPAVSPPPAQHSSPPPAQPVR